MAAMACARSSPGRDRPRLTPPARAARRTRQDVAFGNQARLRGLQAKLAIGPVDDPLEREADAAADQVMGMAGPAGAVSAAPPTLSRKCAACEASTPLEDDAAPVAAQGTSGGGQALDGETRAFMESRFGRDFGDVRIHADAAAAQSAQSVGARAFTVGRDVVFGEGEYQPRAEAGRRLIAHELVHTVQQGAAAAAPTLARTPLDGVSPLAITAGAGPALRMSPECPYSYRDCKGQACVPKSGKGSGFCSWGGSIAAGCQCYAIDQPRLREWVETVLLAALLAIGVTIALAALVALIACFASGACELAVLIGALGLAGALLVVKLLKQDPGAPPVVASADAPSTSEAASATPAPAAAETAPAAASSMASS